MSRTIKAVERHMIPQAKVPPVRLGLQSPRREARRRMAATRTRTLSGHAFRKLRLAPGADPVRDRDCLAALVIGLFAINREWANERR